MFKKPVHRRGPLAALLTSLALSACASSGVSPTDTLPPISSTPQTTLASTTSTSLVEDVPHQLPSTGSSSSASGKDLSPSSPDLSDAGSLELYGLIRDVSASLVPSFEDAGEAEGPEGNTGGTSSPAVTTTIPWHWASPTTVPSTPSVTTTQPTAPPSTTVPPTTTTVPPTTTTVPPTTTTVPPAAPFTVDLKFSRSTWSGEKTHAVDVYLCTPTDATADFFWGNAPYADPSTVVNEVTGATDALFNKLYLGKIAVNFYPQTHIGSCDNKSAAVPVDGHDTVVVQHDSYSPSSSTGLAVYGGTITMNASPTHEAGEHWAGVFAHEFGHSSFYWSHAGYSASYPYETSFDIMTASSSSRILASRLALLSAVKNANFIGHNGVTGGTTSATILANPTDTGRAPGSGEKVGLVVPASSAAVTHPNFFDQKELALVFEGLDRYSYGESPSTNRTGCSTSFSCSAVLVSVISHNGTNGTVGSLQSIRMAGTRRTSSGWNSDTTLLIKVGSTVSVQGLTVTVHSYNSASRSFDISVSGEFNQSFSGTGATF